MDIVYIIGPDSPNDNLELRFSLRSIEKYGLNIDRVIVAGYPPDWLSDKVIKFPYEQKCKFKGQRIFETILAVCDHFKFENDEFLVSMDDHFYVKSVDFNNYPIYCKDYVHRPQRHILPPSLDFCPGQTSDSYDGIMVNTRKYLESHNYSIFNLTLHRNMHIYVDTINKHLNEINELLNYPRDIEIICCLLNMRLKDEPKFIKKIVKSKDFKSDNISKINHLYLPDPECHVISSKQSITQFDQFNYYLRSKYLKKSSYEK